MDSGLLTVRGSAENIVPRKDHVDCIEQWAILR